MREIQLTQGKVALVDDEDFQVLNRLRWCVHKRKGGVYYAIRFISIKNKSYKQWMHRMILPPPEGKEIDHIDGNGLNNQRSNLRIVTHRQNCQNIHVVKTSKYAGVCYNKRDKRWNAQIAIDGKVQHLGCYCDEVSAHMAYENACKGAGVRE
jgi:hypothetical protein